MAQRGTVRVERFRVERAEAPVIAAVGVIANEDVDVSKRAGCGGDQLIRCVGSGEAKLAVVDGLRVGEPA